MSNPELPLGSAEQFLLTLSSISELAARLKLWAFKLDFENSEVWNLKFYLEDWILFIEFIIITFFFLLCRKKSRSL